MQIPVAQVGFFREIQHAFQKGADTAVLVDVLTKFIAIAVPLICVFVAIRYREKIEFFVRRAICIKKHTVVRTRIAEHLKKRQLPLEVYVLKSCTQQFIGRATVAKIGIKRMELGFVSEVPNALSRVMIGKKVICYCRPFKVSGRSVNSFHSYVIKTKPGITGLSSVLLYTPAEYINTVRRSAPRKRPGRPDALKVRLWGGAKKDRFAVLVPDYETDVRTDAPPSWKAAARVVNISTGGLKLEVQPKGGQAQPRVNEQVVLEVLVLDPAKKRFVPFLFMGAVRNVARPSSGGVYLGIQFVAEGERTGSRTVKWHAIQGEVSKLKALLGG